MIIALIVIVTVAVYFTTGFALACFRTPRMWRVARAIHGTRTDRRIESSVRQQFIWCLLIWPFYIPVSLAVQFFEAPLGDSHPYSITDVIRKRDPERRAIVR